MKKIFIYLLIMLSIQDSYAQKQTYDVVNFSIPNGWDKTELPNGMQLSTKDDGYGNYAAAVIIRSVATTASATENFNNSWQALVKGTVKVNGNPTMLEPGKDKGWDIVSGQAKFTDGSNKGLVTLITATGNGKMANVVIMANTNKYQEDILAFVNSLELNENATSTQTENTPASESNIGQSSIAGSWSYGISETQFGTMTNGYSTRQYTFKNDGTYLYRYKVFSSTMNVLLFQYESGKYSLNGNQLTMTPLSGSNEEWSQNQNHPDQWGKLLKTSKRKLEKITYTFTLHYFSGIDETDLILQTSEPTEREGPFGSMQDYPNGWAFKPCNPNFTPLIENPPGFKNN